MSLTPTDPRTAPLVEAVLTRRRMLSFVGISGLGLLAAACGSDSSGTAASATTAGTDTTVGTTSAAADTTAAAAATTTAAGADTTAPAVTDLTATPGETGGPFPADGSNDDGNGEIANILADPRSVRSDITADLDGSNVQEGVPFTLTTTVVSSADGSPLAGAAVYIWHCSKTGEYSEYNSPMLGGDFTDRSFLRGTQITDDNGAVTFTTILPGRYQGRAFHIHFEVYSDGSYGSLLLTSQMAIDDDLITSLYTDAGYDEALGNVTLNSRDNIFNDGFDHQLLTVTGDVTSGLTATFTAVV